MQYIKVNKLLKRPIYLQIADSVELALSNGSLRHNDQLPSERVLCNALQITPKVVKKAYQVLIDKNLVTRIIGKGTYINSKSTNVYLLKSAVCPEYDVEFSKSEILFSSLTNKPNHVKLVDKMVHVDYQLTRKNQQPIAFKRIYFSKEHFPIIPHYENIITFLKSSVEIGSLVINTKLNVQQASDIEASYLNIFVDEPVFFSSMNIVYKNCVICHIDAYYPGRYTIWRDTLARVQL